jgi:DNA-directed RNA polymerase specialized sigma24 family protein
MCEVPSRRPIREALGPSRIGFGVCALLLIVAGIIVSRLIEPVLTGLVVIGLGGALLMIAVLFPVVREVELGFPTGVRISAGLRDREQELHQAFESQRGDFGLYTQLLCDDPDTATKLLEAAWGKTAAAWRGPVTPDIRTYVLCVFVHLLASHLRWAATQPAARVGQEAAVSTNPLASLTVSERIVVVLKEFAELPLGQIAALTERPLVDVSADYRNAEATLARLSISGRSS